MCRTATNSFFKILILKTSVISQICDTSHGSFDGFKQKLNFPFDSADALSTLAKRPPSLVGGAMFNF